MNYAKLNPDKTVAEIVWLETEPLNVRKFEDGTPMLLPLVQKGDEELLNPRTHKRVGPIDKVLSGSVVRSYEIVPLTSAEIAKAAETEIVEHAALEVVARALLDRIRALEGNTPMTDHQMKVWIGERLKSLRGEP
jgi:hypothetical protein